MPYFWKWYDSRISNTMMADELKVRTMTKIQAKTKTKTKTKTKWLKDQTCAIFLKMVWLKDVKYDVKSVMHHCRWCTAGDTPQVMHFFIVFHRSSLFLIVFSLFFSSFFFIFQRFPIVFHCFLSFSSFLSFLSFSSFSLFFLVFHHVPSFFHCFSSFLISFHCLSSFYNFTSFFHQFSSFPSFRSESPGSPDSPESPNSVQLKRVECVTDLLGIFLLQLDTSWSCVSKMKH